MDLQALKRRAAGVMCLWGGVCGYLTVERGTEEDIANEVRQAISVLAPGGGLILAPVTNVRADTQRAWANVRAMIREWHFLRRYPIASQDTSCQPSRHRRKTSTLTTESTFTTS